MVVYVEKVKNDTFAIGNLKPKKEDKIYRRHQ
jgi:hypothetical protein